ncbi:FAD:protein FMN transferase [Sphingobium sp. TB-6]|uniref:FAD:protein FMN transferase n=2 Tax=unclassified Sphingobium TaxID=2611147 RepID=UPI0023F8AA8F|nr:FAD:protein FMN transferase [Sphingobium sp. TB-6]
MLSSSPDKLVTRCQPWLGTFVEISVAEADMGAVEAAFRAIAHIHACMSFHSADSDLARLRSARPGETVAVDEETAAVLRMAVALHEATDGLFDVAVGRALVRSRFLPREGIAHLSRYTGTTADIEIIDDRHVRCRKRLLIDLGGIAKGHAVDRAVAALQAAGVRAGLVNAGGDLRAFGEQDWQVQLRDADDVVRYGLTVRNCAMASSANLFDRHAIRGTLHSPHVGRNGAPALIDHRVTVLADKCAIADAMTKVAMVDADLADRILATRNGYVLRPSMTREAA